MARPRIERLDDRVAEAAAEAMIVHALAGLDRAISRSDLGDQLAMSPDTVRKGFLKIDGRRSAVCTVGSWLFDQEHSGVHAHMNSLLHSVDGLMREPDARPEAVLRAALRLNFLALTATRSVQAAYLLQVAAIATTTSTGDNDLVPDANDLVRRRREHYREMTDLSSAILGVALRWLERRPLPGWTVADITIMLHSAIDGFVMRHSLDTSILDPMRVEEALWQMAFGLTEPGILADPDTSETAQRMVDEALRRYRAASEFGATHTATTSSVTATAGACKIDENAALLLFDSDAALAEACLKHLLVARAHLRTLATATSGEVLLIVREVLRNLQNIGTNHSALVNDVADSECLAELLEYLTDALNNGSDVTGENHGKAATDAVQSALEGDSRWLAILEYIAS